MKIAPFTLLWVILACSAGTLALRLLPMLWHKKIGSDALSPRTHRALAALGPSATGALVLTTLWPQVTVAAPAMPALRLLLALATIALTRKLAGGIAVPTLVGIVVFGGLQYMAFHT